MNSVNRIPILSLFKPKSNERHGMILPYIIAEAGVNHNGNLNLAKKLIIASAKSGADYVKFQTFDPDCMIRKTTKLARYQKINLKKKINQYELLNKLKAHE